MGRISHLRTAWALAVFAVLDVVCVGLGMGVPIFAILLGAPVGWYIVESGGTHGRRDTEMLGEALRAGIVTASFTFVVMALVWSPSTALLFDAQADLANYGIPLILYDARASFIGWLALMVVVAPFLQLLMTLFGAHLALLARTTRISGELVQRGV